MRKSKIKRIWKKIHFFPYLNDDEMERLPDQKSQAVYYSLLRHERLNVNMCICLSLLNIWSFFSSKSMPLIFLVLAGIAFSAIFWQYYKYKFLKRINITEMDITSIIKQYSKFKQYIKLEIIVVSIGLIILFAAYGYFELFLKCDMLNMDFILKFVFSILGMVFFVLLLVLYYIFTYRLNFRNFGETIKAIQDTYSL